MVCLFLRCKCRPSDRIWDEPIAATCLQSAFESAPSVSGKLLRQAASGTQELPITYACGSTVGPNAATVDNVVLCLCL